jgi:hypothetical protein
MWTKENDIVSDGSRKYTKESLQKAVYEVEERLDDLYDSDENIYNHIRKVYLADRSRLLEGLKLFYA